MRLSTIVSAHTSHSGIVNLRASVEEGGLCKNELHNKTGDESLGVKSLFSSNLTCTTCTKYCSSIKS